ncbi:WbqC family protein [Brevibacterium sp.]|uniref:WbqC family protein n=1 Tax=Brevibacterium sp. TaxID=1701 RepID=UPI00281107AA|nr:WbqC family protein [Brevibacterium sp.]
MSWEDEAYAVDLPKKWELSRSAEIDGEIVGYALCSAKEDTLWLHRLVVSPQHRGSGLGARLLREVELTGRAHGFLKVGLKTPAFNESSYRFYRTQGYHEASSDTEYIHLERALNLVTVGVHQPNFLPWLGYFYKMSRSDVFVILDDVLAPSRGYFNRSKVLVQGEARWLSVPVHRNDGYINHMTTVGDEWIAKHLGTLKHNYQRSSFYKDLMPELTATLKRHSESGLSELNQALISHVASLLDISTPTVRSSKYELSSKGDERLVDLVRGVGGSCYLSGHGGDNYQEHETFSSADIELTYTGFEGMPYPQQNTDSFVPGLSAIDALFNIGPDATRKLIDDAPDPEPVRVC